MLASNAIFLALAAFVPFTVGRLALLALTRRAAALAALAAPAVAGV
jgi:hypothetical protein